MCRWLTKSEGGLLVLCALFLCVMAAVLYRTAPPGATEGYTITTQYRAEQVTPEELPPVDINTADTAALEQLDGIGPVLAQRIVDYRSENGPFTSAEELLEVKGIGEEILARLAEQITVGEVP